MEKILALNNIKTVDFIDNSNVVRKYSFTSKMVANSIFIEYYTIGEFEVDEEDYEDDEENDEDFELPEQGSRLSVLLKHRNKYYEFLMFHDTVEIGVPIILLQTIIFLVKLIEETEPDQLIEYLTGVATDPLIPHEIEDKEFRSAALKLLKVKFQTIENLIQENDAAFK
ncbi:hypothetical protein HGH92_26525 [Chitinophaga varians]|uniref:Uncharacterized protein n=1 Tax=Chitinophaga varians TaxID=2202339 RepID=A0A847S458_9BACT|nr:hypothetical protein [Chitinophaga varians]NLR67888.1 hypothetical protein [Chitinophaga varians]